MTAWTDAPLVALDLEGSGAQDRDDEVILEIAVVPLHNGAPSLAGSYVTLINPRPAHPAAPVDISGLTSNVLATAPMLSEVATELAACINGKIIVGHNVGVDYRLRTVHPGAKGNSLTALLDRYKLTTEVTRLVPESQPHRALWDTIGTALLLPALISDSPAGSGSTLSELLSAAGLPANPTDSAPAEPEQASLFDF